MKKNISLENDCIFEKKKWISITGLCNNNCKFCLDGGRNDKFHKKEEKIKKEIKEAKDDGNTKLVISGGDPTIHPNVIDFVKYAKEIGFKKVQLITNGRMFASKEFTEKIANAGLNEVTFSIHGYTPEMHDALTRVPGSFRQIIKGVKNVRACKKKIIINTDTCITKSNYNEIPRIIRFIVEKVGINEINLMALTPQGNAWKYHDEVMPDYEKITPFVKKAIDYCIANNVVIWLSRFPSEYLEGYEEFIEDPYKRVDDVRGMINTLKGTLKPWCKGDRCSFCCINSICDDILKLNNPKIKNKQAEKSNYDNEITITNENISKIPKILENKKGKILLRLAEPEKRLTDYKKEVPKISDVSKILKKFDYENIFVSGIPQCAVYNEGIINICFDNNNNIDYNKYISDGEKDFLGLAEEVSRKVKIKKSACKECMFFNACPGIYQDYVRAFGFSEINPIKSKEIRINMECNQNCLFCNTDKNAENVVSEKKDVLKKIKDWSKEGIKALAISGKEPTIDQNLVEYIEFARKNEFVRVELQTNAIKCANPEFTSKLKNAGLTSAFVSLHAADEETSAKITRAPETFNLTLNGIKNLKNEKIPIIINIVINSLNYKSLENIAILAKEEAMPKRIVFSFVSPVVEAWKNKEIIPKISNTLPYLKKALDYCKNNSIKFNIPSRCGIPLCFLENYKEGHDDFMLPETLLNKSDKIKVEACKSCKYNEKCPGVWERYIEIYGNNEIKSITKKEK